MIKKMVVVASGGALAFALGGVANAGMASAQAAPPTIRDAIAGGGDPPVITHLNVRTSDWGRTKMSNPPGTPVIRDSMVQPGDPPVIRRSNARLGDPDDGGQITSAQTGDPDDGGQITSAQTSDPDDGGQFSSAQTGDPDDGGQIR